MPDLTNYLTTDSDLESVANAIRSKGNTSSALSYPSGFVAAIGNLNVGTGLNPAAAAGDIRAGKKAVVNRTTITGTAPERTSSDLTQSGPTITAPAGYYASAASKSVGAARGSADLTVSGNTVTAPAGYYASAATKAVGTSKGAATYNPSSSDQVIPAGFYLTGAQTIKGVTSTNLSAGNIKKGVQVNVSGIGTITGSYQSNANIVKSVKPYNLMSSAGSHAKDSTETITVNTDAPDGFSNTDSAIVGININNVAIRSISYSTSDKKITATVQFLSQVGSVLVCQVNVLYYKPQIIV